jgi:hypothetical protein
MLFLEIISNIEVKVTITRPLIDPMVPWLRLPTANPEVPGSNPG